MVISCRVCFIFHSLCYLPLFSYVGSSYTCFDDASWAIRSKRLSKTLGEDKQAFYDNFVESCAKAADASYCDDQETYRLEKNLHQPSSVYNYTEMGFKKIRAPKDLYDMVWDFWSANRDRDVTEYRDVNTHHNVWDAPPTIVHINRGGTVLQDKIWESIRTVLEEWTGQLLSPVSLYGIRLYHNNSVLAPHVDRVPLVASVIMNVDQDVDEPWPLEVYDHHGVAHNITMEPGDLVLYESHSIIHGRPFPLNGRFFANLFLHFEPIGPIMDVLQGKTQSRYDIPPYMVPGTYWIKDWKSDHPNGWKSPYTDPFAAARNGDYMALTKLTRMNKAILSSSDQNGLQPLHVAIKAGHATVVRTLYKAGIDINTKTKSGETPLMLSRRLHGEDHKVTKLLIEFGANDGTSKGDDEL